jgi:hypothetical protein
LIAPVTVWWEHRFIWVADLTVQLPFALGVESSLATAIKSLDFEPRLLPFYHQLQQLLQAQDFQAYTMKIKSLFGTLACALLMGSVSVSAKWQQDPTGEVVKKYCNPDTRYTISGGYICFMDPQITDLIQTDDPSSSGIVGPDTFILYSSNGRAALETNKYTLRFNLSKEGQNGCYTLEIYAKDHMDRVYDTRVFCPKTGPRVFPMYVL